MVDSDAVRAKNGHGSPDIEPNRRMSRWFRSVVRLALVLVLLAGLALWAIYSSAQKEPNYYLDALTIAENVLVERGDEFEQHVLDLQNEARTRANWQVAFTDAQINGWLASDFLEKFPGVLPTSVQDPRVGIDVDVFRIAFRFQSRRIKGIVQAEVGAFCTEVPGQLAIRIRKVHSGLVPIPVNSIADRLTAALRRVGLEVEWTEIENDPVALIQIPAEKLKIGNKRVAIESVDLRENELVLTGTSVASQ